LPSSKPPSSAPLLRPRRRPFLWIALGLAALVPLAAVFLALDWWWCLPPGEVAVYVGRAQCARCHQTQLDQWAGSDHDLAMDLATPETVLGDFDNATFEHYGIRSTMTRQGDRFFVTTDGPDGKLQTYPVKYVFGVRPLQQYLIEFPQGRVQCLGIAWDIPGKRWFHLYPHESIPHTDVLHWTKPLQNWNYMCAECHSTNLQKNYDVASDQYHTTWSEINVSCESCHGPGSLHVRLADSWRYSWDRRYGFGLARLKTKENRPPIETCAPCHARRRIVYPGFLPGQKFLDYYVPEMLDSESYWPDGQIKEEDYEYSSFIQSKMYHNGVRCTDCHDPHSMRVKFKEGPVINDNRLCGQCHVPAKYDGPTHHHHPDASKPGTLCIQCHMPTTTYMVVDPRLDHSIRIPRPELTVDLGIPNACNGCHNDPSKGETPAWAVEKVRAWYGPPKGPQHFAYAVAAGRQGKPEGQQLLDAVARRKELPAIVRGSALLLLGRYGDQAVEPAATEGLRDAEDLVRLSAVSSLQSLPPDRLRDKLAPMLSDPVRAVRVESARLLTRIAASLSGRQREAFDAALSEYVKGLESVADQAPAHLNLGVVYQNLNQLDKAEKAYRHALQMDEGFVPARINLAMLYDQMGQKAKAEQEFREVIRRDPKLAEAHYSLGLLLAESKQRLPEALELLTRAAELESGNPRIHYNRGLALQTLGRHAQAEEALKQAYRLSPQAEFLRALAIFYAQQARWTRAVACAEELLRSRPHDPELQRFLQGLRREAQRAANGDSR